MIRLQIENKSALARKLGISRSLIYYQPKRPIIDEEIKSMIEEVLKFNPAYGHKRIALKLKLNHKRILRVMNKFGIKPYRRKAKKPIKKADLNKPLTQFSNLIENLTIDHPNQVWCTDFTYIKYQGKFIYLSTILDRYTREIVGWSLSTRHTKDLIIEAFLDAFQNQGKLPRFIHSDQGSEYNCREYTKLISDLGVKVSMSKKASPWENGYQESFYDNFKTDLGLEFDRFESIGHFVEAIHQAINYYNLKRIHTSLKMSPAQFRQQYNLRQIQFRKVV